MTPPISKDWWLAAALSTATVPAALAQTPSGTAGGSGSGVVTAVAPGGQVTGNNEVMVVGSSVVPGQRLRTNATGVLHVLFMDQSALTLGPDSELSIDAFNFDPATQQGQIRLGLAKGTLRVVGGQISKNTPTQVSTPHGKVELQGGIGIIDSQPNSTSGTFLFGQSMRFTSTDGSNTNINRAGFGTTMGNGGVGSPQRTSTSDLNQMLSNLERRPGSNPNPSPNPSPAPSGQLLSTGNNPGGANDLGSSLANDRLKNVIDNNVGANPSNTLKTLLGTGQIPIQS